ncbi:MAG TPA: pseudouridine-5'-phosphate glycosidase, partial [Aestuariivirga sp.]
YSRSSRHKVPTRLNTPKEVAALMKAKWKLNLKGGVVVANPIPETAEIPADEIEPVILRALGDAKRAKIIGKETTPFLLKAIVDATKGRSLAANIALVENNARLAAAIAIAYSQ